MNRDGNWEELPALSFRKLLVGGMVCFFGMVLTQSHDLRLPLVSNI